MQHIIDTLLDICANLQVRAPKSATAQKAKITYWLRSENREIS